MGGKTNHPAPTEVSLALEALDKQITECMLCAEKGYQKLRSGHYEFSPPVKSFLDRFHAFWWLLRFWINQHHNKIEQFNIGNMKRFVQCYGIIHPMRVSTTKLAKQYHLCKEDIEQILAESPWIRTEYLTTKLPAAINTENDVDAMRLRSILCNEQQKKVWQGTYHVTKPTRPSGVTKANIPHADGALKVCNTQTSLEEGLASSLSKRFKMPESAPICHGALFELLGYSANTKTAEQILQGTFISLIHIQKSQQWSFWMK